MANIIFQTNNTKFITESYSSFDENIFEKYCEWKITRRFLPRWFQLSATGNLLIWYYIFYLNCFANSWRKMFSNSSSIHGGICPNIHGCKALFWVFLSLLKRHICWMLIFCIDSLLKSFQLASLCKIFADRCTNFCLTSLFAESMCYRMTSLVWTYV